MICSRHRIDLAIALALLTIVVWGVVAGRDVRQRNRHCSEGEMFFGKGEYQRAVDAYTQAILHDPACASAYANRASAYFNMGRIGRSLEDFDRAVEIDPGLAVAYWRRGIVHATNGDSKRAEADRAMARRLDPGVE